MPPGTIRREIESKRVVRSLSLLPLLALLGCGGDGDPIAVEGPFCDSHTSTDVLPLADQNLAQAARDELGVSILTCADASRLTSLDAHGRGITELGGIENFPSLEFLYLFENSITDVRPLASLSRLEVLWLYDNSVTDIGPLSGLEDLRQLYLWDNAVTDIRALASLTSLVALLVGNNGLTDISVVASFTGLQRLTFGDNSITDLTALAGLTSLRSVDASGNHGVTDIQPLLDNPGIGPGDEIYLDSTGVSCQDVAALEAKGPTVYSDC